MIVRIMLILAPVIGVSATAALAFFSCRRAITYGDLSVDKMLMLERAQSPENPSNVALCDEHMRWDAAVLAVAVPLLDWSDCNLGKHENRPQRPP